MTIPPLDDFPEFRRCIEITNGDVKAALTLVINQANKEIDALASANTDVRQINSTVEQYFKHISQYFEATKICLSETQIADVGQKILQFRSRVSYPTSVSSGGGFFSGIGSVFSAVGSWFGGYAKAVAVESPAEDVDSGLKKDLENGISITHDSLVAVNRFFEGTVSEQLKSNNYLGLLDSVDTLNTRLIEFQASLEATKDLYSKNPALSNQEIEAKIRAFELDFNRFESYVDSIKRQIELHSFEVAQIVNKPVSLQDVQKEVKSQTKGAGSGVPGALRGLFGTSSSSPSSSVAATTHGEGAASVPAVGILTPPGIGFPNLGVTCFVNTFFKTCFPYFELSRQKKLNRRPGENDDSWNGRNELRETLLHLVDEVRNPNPDQGIIRNLLEIFVNNRLLGDVIHILTRSLAGNTYDLGSARDVANRVFDLLEIDQDPNLNISLEVGYIFDEVENKHRTSGFRSEGRFSSIPISGPRYDQHRSIQSMIDRFSIPYPPDRLWKANGENNPAVLTKRTNYLVADPRRLPQRLMLTTTQPAAEALLYKDPAVPYENIEDNIAVPIYDRNGTLLGRMQMTIEAIACNRPNAHFIGYVKEQDGSWTEHNDSIVIRGLTKDQVMFGVPGAVQKSSTMNASLHGCQFNYRTTGFIPAEARR